MMIEAVVGRRPKTDIETDLFKESKLIRLKSINMSILYDIVLNTHLNRTCSKTTLQHNFYELLLLTRKYGSTRTINNCSTCKLNRIKVHQIYM